MTAARSASARWRSAAALLAIGLAALMAARGLDFDAGAATAAARTFASLHPALAAAAFSIISVVVAALAVPVVAIMTVAAGALFGPWLGLPLAVASSAAGATIAMLAVRYALRERVAARFPHLADWLSGAPDGRSAALLFAARATPVVPFALVNIAAGMSRMPARTFALVSVAGATPLAFLYVSAGATIGAFARPEGVLSPRHVAILALAGAAPLAARACAARLKPGGRRSSALFGPH